MENTEENVLKWLKSKKAIPVFCENNEYWTYWRNMLFEYGKQIEEPIITNRCSFCGHRPCMCNAKIGTP